MPGTKWVTADVITFARMNQKTLIVQAAEPVVMYAGMMWLDIDDDMLYQRKAANDGWHTAIKEELAYTITGLHTFNRGAAAPFAVDAASTKVANLDADMVDGVEEAAFMLIAGGRNWNIPDPSGDHEAKGITITETAGENVAIGDVCYFKNDGKFWKADADAEATSKGWLVLATAAIAAEASGIFLVYGKYRDDSWTWTVAQELFIHTTGGNPTGTRPIGSGDIVRIVAHASAATILFFNPDQTYIELS